MSAIHIRKIQAYSRLVKAGVVLLVLPIAASVAYYFYAIVFQPEIIEIWVQRHLVEPEAPVRLTPAVLLVLTVIGACNITLIANGLAAIWRLCQQLDAGIVFAPKVGSALQQAGFYALACAICQFVSNILAVIAVTINNPDGQKQLAISVSSDMAFLVVVSGLLMVMGHIIVIASDIDAENKEFI